MKKIIEQFLEKDNDLVIINNTAFLTDEFLEKNSKIFDISEIDFSDVLYSFFEKKDITVFYYTTDVITDFSDYKELHTIEDTMTLVNTILEYTATEKLKCVNHRNYENAAKFRMVEKELQLEIESLRQDLIKEKNPHLFEGF